MKPKYSPFGISCAHSEIRILTLVVATAFGIQSAQAANTDHVVVSGGGNVGTAGTFSAGGVPGSAPGDMLTYNIASTAGTVTIDSSTTIGAIRNLGTGTFTVSAGAGTLTLDGTGYTPASFGFSTTTTTNEAYIDNGTSLVTGAALTVDSAISMNTNLGIGSRRNGSGLITIGGAITNGSGSAKTLYLYAAGGSITNTGNIGASGDAIAINNNGSATSTATLSGNLGASVTTVTVNTNINGSLVLSGANIYTGATTLTVGKLTAQDGGTNNFIKALSTTHVNLNGGTLFLNANGSGSNQTIITGDGTTGNNVVVGGTTTISVNRVNGSNTGSTIQLNNLSIGANTLNVTNNNSYALQFAGTTTLTGNATFSPGGTLTLSGAVGDGGNAFGFTKGGAGTLVLAGANTYTGTTTITTGVLQLGNGGTTGSLSTTGAIVNNANLTINRFNAVAQGTDFSSAAITGTGSFTHAGSGTTTLNAANSFNGGLTIQRNGNLVLDYATNATVVNSANVVTLGNGTGGTLTIKGNSGMGTTTQTLGALTFSTAQDTVVVDNNGGGGTSLALGSLTRNSAGSLLFDLSSGGTASADLTANATGGRINLVDGVLVAGQTSTSVLGVVVRTGTNTYDFATGSTAGTGASITALGATTDLVAFGGATNTNYKVSGDKSITDNTTSSTIRVDTTAANNKTLSIARGKTLTFGKNTILFDGTGNFDIAGPGTIGGTNAMFIQQWSTGTVTIGSTVGLAAQRIDKYGTGLLVNNSTSINLNALNIYGGVYRAGSSASLSTGNIALATGGVLELTSGSGDFVRALGTGATNVQFLSDGGFSASGGDRVVAFNGTGSPTALTWGSTTNFLGSGNKLILSGSTSDSTIDFRNAIDFNGIQREINVGNGTAGVDAILSGVLSSTVSGGGLHKSGAGAVAVTNANTYTGPTTVNAGTLLVNNTTGSGTGTGTVSVASGGTLGGTGSIGGATTINSGGIHSAGGVTPADRVGKQTFSANASSGSVVTYSSGSIFEWNMAADPSETGRGTSYDAVNVTGTMTGGATQLGGSGAIFRVVLDNLDTFGDSFWTQNREWTEIFKTADGGTALAFESIFSTVQYYNYSGAGGTLVNLGTPTSGSFTINGSSLNWNFSAVPEPTSALAGLLLGCGLLRRRRA